MTDGSQGCIVVYKILILSLISPINGIYTVRLVIAVLHSLLVAVEFLTIEDERNTLGCIHCSLSKLDHCKALCFRSLGSLLKAVTQTVVVVAAHIAHMLERIICPTLNTHLRMLHTSCNTELYICLISLNTVHKTGILTTERSTDRVTDVITESTHLVEHMSIDLQSNLILREGRSHCSPALTIEKHSRIDGMQTLADDIHRLYVVDSHKVETETVDMVLLHPPL